MNVNSATAMARSAYSIYNTSLTNTAFRTMVNQSYDTASSLLSLYNSNSSSYSLSFSSSALSSLGYSSSSDLTNSLATNLSQSTLNTFKSELKSYAAKAEKFYNEFDPAMTSLKDSGETLAKTDFSSGQAGTIWKNVQNFVEDYNSAVSVVSKNSSESQPLQDLSDKLAQTRYSKYAFAKIGISVSNSGTMSINQDKLTESIVKNPSAVEKLFGGTNGLAAKTASRADSAIGDSTLLPFKTTTGLTTSMQGQLFDMFM